MTTEATLELDDREGRTLGHLTITCLRGRERWREIDALLDLRPTDTDPYPAAPVQLLEEMSYAYSVTSAGHLPVLQIEPSDLFTSTNDAAEGRLEAHRATGTLSIAVVLTDDTIGYCEVEIRSRKLNYETEYRDMLLRISKEAAELIQSAFAPSALPAFRPDAHHDPQTVYQRFAFIKALVESEEVRNALHLIQRRPHFEHVTIHEKIDPARATRASPLLVREVTAPGRRQPTARPIAGLLTVPRTVTHVSNETTYDTVPNRFVRYVLKRWQDIAVDVGRTLAGASPAEQRGRREAQLVADDLDRTLSSVALAEAGTLTAFPHSNQVLQGRSGYREVLEAFLLAEAASTINWDDRDRLFQAGQRNVAELYEYWVFLELVHIVELLPGFRVDKRSLVKRTDNGLSLELRRTGDSVVTGTGVRRGTAITLKVWFNKAFPRDPSGRDASWTVTLRPDCSIQIIPANRAINAATWIHFDAKYRIHELTEELDDAVEDEAGSGIPGKERPISDDLAKMHVYRDAIRRTAGSYVLYPGHDDAAAVRHQAYHEVLPGLGGFALRPTNEGEASATTRAGLVEFVDDVIDHIASQGTQAERARYWTEESYSAVRGRRVDHQALLAKPAADTSVLLGSLKSMEHLDWVLAQGDYNLRADLVRAGAVGVDAPELSPDFVVVYGSNFDKAVLLRAAGRVSVRSRSDLESTAYPDPGGDRYFCLAIHLVGELPGASERFRDIARHGRDRRSWAAPRLVSWLEVAELLMGSPWARG